MQSGKKKPGEFSSNTTRFSPKKGDGGKKELNDINRATNTGPFGTKRSGKRLEGQNVNTYSGKKKRRNWGKKGVETAGGWGWVTWKNRSLNKLEESVWGGGP